MYVGEVGRASGCRHEVGQAHLPTRQRVGARECHLAVHAHVLLLAVLRALAHEHLVERLEHESLFAIHHEAVFKGKREVLGYHAVGGEGLWVAHAARHVHFHGGGTVGEASGLEHEVFQRLVVSILVHARVHHLSLYGYGLVVHGRLLGWNEKHVVFFQRNVRHGVVHYALYVDRNHAQRAVGLHAVHHGACRESIFG